MTRKGDIYAGMGRGTERRHGELPGMMSPDHPFSEIAHRNFLRFWANMMSSETWAEVLETQRAESARRGQIPLRAAS